MTELEITPTELKKRLDAGEKLLLVDVRERWEHQVCRIEGSRLIPMQTIPASLQQLDVEEPTHAFYLGRELAKAKLAVSLGKTYRQEGALQWGYLTPPDDRGPEHVKLTQRSTRSRGRGTPRSKSRR